MSKAGQSNYRGVNSQAKAAILLFLVNFSDPDFNSIVLEDVKWEDFTLKFQSGKKSICEAKAWSRKLSVNDVVNILGNIAPKTKGLNKRDDIIIVCNEVDERLERDLEYLNYGLKIKEIPSLKRYRKPEKLTPSILKLLKRVKFYKLPAVDRTGVDDYLFNETVARLYQILPLWVPQDEVERLMTHVLKEQIYDKSESGKTFTKQELAAYLEDYKAKRIERAGAYDSAKQKVIKQVDRMISATVDTDEQYLLQGDNLVALSAQPMKMFIALDLITKRTPFVLRDWDTIWDALIDRSYSFRIIHIFEQSLESKDNAEYIIDFLKKNIGRLDNPLIERHNREFAIDLVAKAVEQHPELTANGLKFMQEFLKTRDEFYMDALSRRDLSYEKENVIKVLTQIYNNAPAVSDNLSMKAVIELLDTRFNLVEDDSEHALLTPTGGFEILKQWLLSDFDSNFPVFLKMLRKHYKKMKYYGQKFSGWDLTGGMESGWSKQYSIHDRNFIKHVLSPAFKSEYQNDKEKFWQFLKSNLVTLSEKEVSGEKPDFLSRAAIPVIINEYFHGAHSKEALDILGKFYKVRKGIPERYKLIFQDLSSYEMVDDNKRWELTKLFLDSREDKLPPSVFVEQAVLQIASTGNEEALSYIEGWMDDPRYLDKQNRWNFYIDAIIGKLLESDNKKVADKAVDFLKRYLASDDFQSSLDKFHAWDMTPLMAKVFKINPNEGIETLRLLYDSHPILPVNIQVIITSSLSKIEKDDRELILKAYDDFLKPILFTELGSDIQRIVSKFTDRHGREDFIRFAELLIGAKYFEQGMSLLRVFIADPDPPLTNYPEDPEGTFNYHEKIKAGDDNPTINTVRGWCPFAIQKMVRVGGQTYIPEVLDMVERLLKDENYHVRLQAIIPLADLAANRHTVIPPERKDRFMSLKTAQEIENLAFEALEDKDNRQLKPVMERLAYCFSYLRSINEASAKKFLQLFSSLEFEADIEHLPGLYIFFAEFRKKNFSDKSLEKVFGKKLYDELQDYDEEYFKEFLKDKIVNAPSNMRRSLAWHFWTMPREDGAADKFDEAFELSHRYLLLFTEKYDHHTFEMLFHFIDDNLEKKPAECIKLWKAAIQAERDYLVANEKDIVYHQNWWDRLHTADTLLVILREQGEDEFLSNMEVMLSYPAKLQGIHNPQSLYAALKAIKGNRAKSVIEKFEESYPHIYAQEKSQNSTD